MLLRPSTCRFCHARIVEEQEETEHAVAAGRAKQPPPPLPSPPARDFTTTTTDSFVFVQKSHDISAKMDNEVKRKLDAYAAGASTITHSLCSKCFDYPIEALLADENKLQIKQASIARATERLLVQEKVALPQNNLDRLAQLQRRHAQLVEEIARANAAAAAWQQDVDAMRAMDEEIFARQCSFTHGAIEWRQEKHWDQETLDALRARFDHSKQELVQPNSVINDAFFIWEQPPYFVINNMRLGRSFDSHLVEWQEVNAAWGEVCLLLYTLARKEQYEFKHCILLPRGRVSLVQDLKSGKQYELFYVEEQQQCKTDVQATNEQGGLLFKLWSTVLPPAAAPAPTAAASVLVSSRNNLASFNQAMVTLLLCVKELGDWAQASERGMNLCLKGKLFAIKSSFSGTENGATIFHHQIKTTGEETDAQRWSEACKYLLSNLKWLCSWSMSSSPQQPQPQQCRAKEETL